MLSTRHDGVLNLLNRFDDEIYFKIVQLEGYAVRGALILGTEKAVIFDTLSRPYDMVEYEKIIGNRELSIIYSHADWDHIWGTAGVTRPIKSIIAHRLCFKRFSHDVPETLKEYQKNQPELYNSVKLIPPDVVFDYELEIDLGGMTLQINRLAGHTEDSIVCFIPEKGILLAGDSVETPFPCINKNSPITNWITELEKWEDNTKLKTVIPAHGATGGPEIITQNLKYLNDLINEKEIEITESLTSFYKETHAENIAYVSAQKISGKLEL
ncbi:MBL fold metallo-hydrolase [Desulfovibrio gilichinskyi]|uniref:Glyoxylase, beta-lactamase superfamily II n=1 Tax=Desulfovibrio gilichinskyi TaxID=1519643 RepID=A0A1X7CWV9_9BACT|nr:MBL fold metallo-hydrolase [Desulfovibrio gilichinskyi]SMF04574.1 Glyoxylase, beta-lactamase superfamily II [Desulfovibrio gilichinskyi]